MHASFVINSLYSWRRVINHLKKWGAYYQRVSDKKHKIMTTQEQSKKWEGLQEFKKNLSKRIQLKADALQKVLDAEKLVERKNRLNDEGYSEYSDE